MDVPGSSSQVNQPSSALPFDLNNLPSDHSLDDDVISDLDENAISTQKQQEIVRGYDTKRTRDELPHLDDLLFDKNFNIATYFFSP
ncbi:hypothetical protein LINPERPRIM_LOCUS31810 [Linum perenne]